MISQNRLLIPLLLNQSQFQKKLPTMIPDDQVRIIFAMLVSIPLSYFIRFIPLSFQKQLYSLILGSLLQYYVYGSDLVYVFMLHIVIYAICYKIPQKAGGICTLLSIAVLSIYHIYRMITDYGSWKMDISGVLMMMVCKYSLFAYAIQDGTIKDQTKLSKQSQQNCLKKIPSFFSYLSYCQFLPTAVIGTAIEYKKYNDYIFARGYFSNIPAPWRRIAKDVAYSLVLVAIHFCLGQMIFSLNAMKDPQFPNSSFFRVAYFSYFGVTFLRYKYYFAWKLSMGAVHAAGLSYREYTVKGDKVCDWKGVQTCNPWIVETSIHLKDRIDNWNMSTQYWLKRCIYDRCSFKNKANAQLFTFMVSSFWHGFYGGYYLSFFFWFCQTNLQQTLFRISKNPDSKYYKMYKKTGKPGYVFMWILGNVVFSINGVFFQVLSLRQGYNILCALYFVPPLIVFAGMAFFTVFPDKKPRKTEKPIILNKQDKGNNEKQRLTTSTASQ